VNRLATFVGRVPGGGANLFKLLTISRRACYFASRIQRRFLTGCYPAGAIRSSPWNPGQ